MEKFKRLQLPVFKIMEDGLSSYQITYTKSKGVSVRQNNLADGQVEQTMLQIFSDTVEIKCTVEDEHQNKIRFTYQKSKKHDLGFIAYLREILDEHQYLISKNMSVVDCVRADVNSGILIKLALDINPVLDDFYGF